MMHVGCINEIQGKNWILGCLKYLIMFENMQYYSVYLQSTYKTISVSVCCGTLINKMVVSDETSLISSEVECMGLKYTKIDRSICAMLNYMHQEFSHLFT